MRLFLQLLLFAAVAGGAAIGGVMLYEGARQNNTSLSASFQSTIASENENRFNAYNYVHQINANATYDAQVLGGIKNCEITVNNPTDYSVSVTVLATVVKANGGYWDSERISVEVAPNSSETKRMSGTTRGTSVETTIESVYFRESSISCEKRGGEWNCN